jgi:hypothetical protein
MAKKILCVGFYEDELQELLKFLKEHDQESTRVYTTIEKALEPKES